MITTSSNGDFLDVYCRKAAELRLEVLLSLPVCRVVDVARPTAAAQSSGGRYTLPTFVTRLMRRSLSEARQVYFAVRPQTGATAEVGRANLEPGARVCSSSHRVYLLRIPMYWVYLNGYMKRCRPSVGGRLGGWRPSSGCLLVAETAVALTKNTLLCTSRRPGLHLLLPIIYVRREL